MAKQKHKAEQPEIKQPEQEINLSQVEQAAFDVLDNLFHVHEDNYNVIQDEPLLFLIENENSVNDKLKIKYLFKKYRDEARENHNQ